MLSELRTVIRSAAKYMTGFERRRFMATMAMSIVTVALVRQKRVWASNRLPRSAIHCNLPTLCNFVGSLVRLFVPLPNRAK
jgi:hypothetical protein